jgi:hypothetical protein
LREVLRTQLSDASCPHLVLRIGLVTQVALSVRRDPGDVLFPAGDDPCRPRSRLTRNQAGSRS